jgi:hypothetical protein
LARNSYQFGLRDAPYDYETKQSFCSSNKTNHKGSCQAQPLMQIPLLGILLKFQSKYIMLCPQRSCGLPCVYDPHQTVFTARGPSCVFCCEVLRNRRATASQNAVAPWRVKPYCIMCGAGAAPISDAQSCMYPAGVVVCKRHSLRPLLTHIQQWVQDQPDTPRSYDDVVEKVVKFMAAYRANKKAINEPRQKRQLQQSKSRARNSGKR